MVRPFAATSTFAAMLGFAALIALPATGFAQQGLPALKPPPAAPVKPYQTVAVTPPQPLNDPGFIALRKQIGDVTAKKDRTALAKLVVAQNFFWLQDKNLADPKKSGIDNLAKAIDLDAKDGSGWETLAGYANKDGVEVHQTAKPNSPVVEKLGVYLVRVLADSGQGADPNAPLFLHIATPDGKTGFADAQLISPLGSDQMCYSKDASGWKIAGYIGGASP